MASEEFKTLADAAERQLDRTQELIDALRAVDAGLSEGVDSSVLRMLIERALSRQVAS